VPLGTVKGRMRLGLLKMRQSLELSPASWCHGRHTGLRQPRWYQYAFGRSKPLR